MKLYALCDQATLTKNNISLDTFVAKALKHKAEVIQYRNKDASIETSKKSLLHLRKIWDGFLIINDHVDLVPFCDGVHLGQEDLLRFGHDAKSAVKAIREVIHSDKLLGISTHNKKEILEANKLDLNYIGLGAYRATDTKDVPNILGEKLDRLAQLSAHPVGAIGGIKLNDSFDHVTYLVVGSDLYEH